MHISEIETPAIMIDLDIMERNLRRVAEYARHHDLRLRPHTKTHKIPALGRMQIELGAVGLTVAKVGEAEVMVTSGTPDLLVAYPVIGRRKLERLMQVARAARVTVALDSVAAARQLSDAAREAQAAIGVLAEVDAGMGRVGVAPGEELLQLIRNLERLPHLSFEGIEFYPGHIRGGDDGGRKEIDRLGAVVGEMLAGLRRAGIEARIVGGGSTPTLFHSHLVAGMNEIRPGTYIFNDKNTVVAGACAYDDCAASIHVTVVSIARPGQIIIDGGSKTFSSDRLGGAGEATFGRLVEAPDAVFVKLNEEHGYVDVRRAGRDFAVGDRLRVIPNHICVAMNLHEQVYGFRGETVEQVWKVEGRGKLQ
ncbi:MAG: alanine racemase [Bryobacterales bacterium]|nr:alanine racemase [Bryobacterales bacterium]